MILLDLILNVAGLLLWLSWCSLRLDPFTRTTPATIVGTVRRAEPRALKAWHLLAGLTGLLAGRGLFYLEIASAVGWTPKLDLGFVVLAFRSDLLGPVMLYSFLSFVKILSVFYFWLLTLVLINWTVADPDPIQKLLRLHLGWLARWPRPLLLLLPFGCVAAAWLAVNPLLAAAGVVARPDAFWRLLEQSFLLTLELVRTLKYFLPPFLLLHLLATYVYLGSSPVWDFVGTTARNLLQPLAGLPLRLGKLELRPIVGALLLLVLLHWGPNLLLGELNRRNVPLWPQ